jgi:tight adherence protein C
MFPLLVTAVLLIIGMVIVLVGLVQRRRANILDERLAALTEQVQTLEELELQLPFRQRVLEPALQNMLTTLGKFSLQKNFDKTKRSLDMAGNPGSLSPVMFMGMRTTIGLLGLFLGFYLGSLMELPLLNRLLFAILGGAIGYVVPGIWLGQKIKARKYNILKSMPDALDLLTISVEAGLGFDLALQRVADKWENELSKEFRRVISDTRLGTPRREAMRMMADRCDVEDLTNFVQALIQAEQLGVSIGKILKVQSEQMRVRRRQRAQEQAQKAPVKMLFPMVFLIFPSILVVLLGPAIPKIMSGLGNL